MSLFGTDFSFIHCADLHLDSPFEGLHDVDSQVGQVLRDSTFDSFDRIITLAIQRQVDFIVISGDVYDSADHSLRAQLRFRDSLDRADREGINSYVIHGNHDPLDSWDAQLELPESVHRFGGEHVTQTTATRAGRPLADLYGISFATREIKRNLAVEFQRTGNAPFSIGLLHCNLGGDPNHDNYAPCSLADLQATGIDYWALGHVHTRAEIHAADPTVVYPGNIQGRSIRETGSRGCYHVAVSAAGSVKLEFLATDSVRWIDRSDSTIDVESISTLDGLLAELEELRERLRSAQDGSAAIARIELTGRSPLHSKLIADSLEQDLLGTLREGEADRPDFVWFEAIKVSTRPELDLDARRKVDDFVGDYLRVADEMRQDSSGELIRSLLLNRPESKRIQEAIQGFTTEELLEMLREAEWMGLDRLLEDDE